MTFAKGYLQKQPLSIIQETYAAHAEFKSLFEAFCTPEQLELLKSGLSSEKKCND